MYESTQNEEVVGDEDVWNASLQRIVACSRPERPR